MAALCATCPWSRPIPAYVGELNRLHQLLGLGFSIPIGALERWQEDALLVLDDELHRQAPKPDTAPRGRLMESGL